VQVLSEALPLLSVFDLSGCARLTSAAVASLCVSRYLRVINLDRCTGIGDEGIAKLAGMHEILEGISLVGMPQISDDGLLPVANACRALSYINLNNCSNVTDVTIEAFARHSRQLQTLHVSACGITEGCFNELAGLLPAKHLTSLDISFCREATDNSITAIVTRCANLNYLNLTGLTRLTERAVRVACSNLWSLRHLLVEDVFLIDDRAFWFDIEYDSRQAAGEKMLRELRTLSLADCSHLTDRAIGGLAARCRKLEKLILKGCDKLTDKSLRHMIKKEDHFKFPLCDALKHLDIAYCRKITSKGLSEVLPKCLMLEELVLTGVPFVNDEVVTALCLACPTLIRLTFEKCSLITDMSICAITKHLWIER
jgi:F-box and leucine-rich repeat protein GRR1